MKRKDYEMPEEELFKFATMATRIRAKLKERVASLIAAGDLAVDDSDDEHKDVQAVANRAITKRRDRFQQEYSLGGFETRTIKARQKTLARCSLSPTTIRAIITAVMQQ